MLIHTTHMASLCSRWMVQNTINFCRHKHNFLKWSVAHIRQVRFLEGRCKEKKNILYSSQYGINKLVQMNQSISSAVCTIQLFLFPECHDYVTCHNYTSGEHQPFLKYCTVTFHFLSNIYCLVCSWSVLSCLSQFCVIFFITNYFFIL